MKEAIIIMLLFLAGLFLEASGQAIVQESTENNTEDVIQEEFMEDFIVLEGREYRALIDESFLPLFVAEKNLESKIGSIEQRIENSAQLHATTAAIYAPHWDVGVKLYKIKKVNKDNCIAVEWNSGQESKYYVYVSKKVPEEIKILEQYFETLISKEMKTQIKQNRDKVNEKLKDM